MKKKVLIIGGAGFIGLNLAKQLSTDPQNIITIADNFFRGQMDDYLKEVISESNVKFIEGDFTKSESYEKLGIEYDQLYMLASVVGVNNTLEMPSEVIRINSLLILNTLEWLKKSKIKKVLFTSTSENYAGTIDKFGYTIPTPEDVPLTVVDISHPRYTYAVTKILGESGFLNYARSHGFECTIVRYHNVIGPRMGFKHVIPHLAERFLKKNEDPFLMYGHDQTRAFCYISDAVEGTIRAMECNKSAGEIYHIGTEDEVSIEDLIKEAGKFFGYEGKYQEAPTFSGSTQRRCPDISKAEKDFNYNPKVQWKEALISTLSWYQDFFQSGVETFESGFKKPE